MILGFGHQRQISRPSTGLPCARSVELSSSWLCVAGDSGPPVLLIHGFGASAYHWRYQVPSLARNHRVYAIDLLGTHTSFVYGFLGLELYLYGIDTCL
jgi:pimeloyl-ACP methyl ester carboxylesterase